MGLSQGFRAQDGEGALKPPGKRRPFGAAPAGSASAAPRRSPASGIRSRHFPSPVDQGNALVLSCPCLQKP